MNQSQTIVWGNGHLQLHISHGPDDAPRLLGATVPGEPAPEAGVAQSALPLVEIVLAGDGKYGTAGKRHVDGASAQRLRLVGHESGNESGNGGAGPHLRVDMRDEASGLGVHVHYELPGDGQVLRTWSVLEADGEADVVVEYVSSLALGGLAHGRSWEDDVALWHAPNPWSGEFRWQRATLAERGLYDVGMVAYDQVGSKNRIAVTSVGAWSTSEYLPMGILEDLRTGRMIAWQVEHNGAWHWEIADRYGDLYLTASGPTAQEHQCAVTLRPGQSFTTVPAALVVVAAGTESGLDAIGAALTHYRRATRRVHTDHLTLPVVYNDFLNALMADPTTEREIPLIEAAADLGAEIYCIDAGWYDDERGGWWDSVGEWKPSTNRFPDGELGAVIERIRATGMKPGLWLEPEVIGRRSPVADALPAEAFFQRDGRRIQEWGRYQLDLRHPAARAHLDCAVDRLMADFDLAYLKLDYNIDIGAGTDGSGTSVGLGLLGHARAFLDWVEAVMDRYPGLTVEGCAAGGSRMDGASGAVFPLQSLTDQQDYRSMPPISAAAPLAIAPEQSGVWASVDGSMGDEQLAFSLISALLGRVHLSGRIDTLSPHQRDVVRQGLEAYRELRTIVARSVPIWPLGLPGWRDGWVVAAHQDDGALLLAVHRRDGAATIEIPLGSGFGPDSLVDVVYPTWGQEKVALVSIGAATTLQVTLPETYSARLLRIERA